MDYEIVARASLAAHGFKFTHSLGQNFLLNRQIIEHIVDMAEVGSGANVLEIGAGAGVLTAALNERGANICAVEIDRALEPVLRDVLDGRKNVRLVFADALKVDLSALADEAFGGAPYQVVANLPYYITSDILLRLVTLPAPPRSICVMVQKEACDRIMAEPGEKAYCALAATLKYYGEVHPLMNVPPRAFTPPPHVDSVLMKIDLYEEKPVQALDDAWMRRVIDACFAMRRKTLLNNLTHAFHIGREEGAALISSLGIDPRVRGEALSLGDVARICDALYRMHAT